MLNIDEINNTINELEIGDTTFANCQKLASLYIVRDNLLKSDVVVNEYRDILPAYKDYCDIKRKYQMHEVTDEAVKQSIRVVCKEVYEFLHILYSSTDILEEREQILATITDIGYELSKRS